MELAGASTAVFTAYYMYEESGWRLWTTVRSP
jgi:hypothetical protein